MKLRRICIYPKDIQGITGRSERYGRKLIKEIKDHLGKASHQFVTTMEFSEYTGIHLDIIEAYIQQTS
ncbi:hypothetical protein ESZ48_04345 [Gelidibacter gilvus]|uniref:Uncharacterized protein n=1 Tax=Gelidibacter gilvus TaxID=59602 RepID=A0A4Q0XJ13_9FLAO|nr:hypothetical protein ESZ48_04345 [Gelidibacter gilvus]